MKISKKRKVFPFYEHHGNLVYIGGVQRKLKLCEEERLLGVLFRRKIKRIGQDILKVVSKLQSNQAITNQ